MDLPALISQCAPSVHPDTMHAIVSHESRGNPFAIGVNKGGPRLTRQPSTLQEAVNEAMRLVAAGHDFDVGLGQLNVANIRRLGLRLSDAFDPCTNLRATSGILSENYTRAMRKFGNPSSALKAALSAYNTGSFQAGIRNGYVSKVLKVRGVTQNPSATESRQRVATASQGAEQADVFSPVPSDFRPREWM